MPDTDTKLSEQLRIPMRYLSRTAIEGGDEDIAFAALGDSIIVNEGDFHTGQMERRFAADALDANDARIGELTSSAEAALAAMEKAVERADAAESRLASQDKLLAEAREALQPFAGRAAAFDGCGDNWFCSPSVQVGDLRHARSLLRKLESPDARK